MSLADEYRAVREGAGLVESLSRAPIAVTGPDRASFLQGLLTNDIVALAPGTGCYAAYLTPQGRMIADVRVLELGDRLILDVPAAVKDGVLGKLDQSIFTEDVQLQDLSSGWRQLGVHGPRAPEVLERVIGDALPPDLATWPEFRNARFSDDGGSLVITSTRALGEIGFEVFVERDRGDVLRQTLRAAGAVEVGPATMEVLRVEAGRPEFGVDMDEETIPLEAGLADRAISFTKGCYVGQEVVIRILHRGHGRVARRLVGLAIDADPDPPNVPARSAALVHGDQPVGEVTSAVASPAVGKPIALGYVKRDFAEPGTALHVRIGARQLACAVAALPFYRRA